MDAWERRMQERYGITAAQYQAILELQNGGCAVCGKTPQRNGKRLAVDHNHKPGNGRIRGLLCTFCNSIVVAQHLDNARIAAGLAEYILNPKAPLVLGPDHRVPETTAARPRKNTLTASYQSRLLARDLDSRGRQAVSPVFLRTRTKQKENE